ncbi:ABC transporter permease [Devosia algicola]|uniref:ABC transporter permease n=1 Tax=Devosia algicola TaxID=3026418 RepID=A0ABY7YJ12_9HYPH|nr:ABC transporter permease [Devosia algicola]WDR01298.1 ABC transporter permease [Devosia algicola]
MNWYPAFSRWTQANRWFWSALAVAILWLVLSVVTNRFSIASLSGILLSASFLTIVGLGQMFVVTTGRGNIDLSIPSVITLNAYLALLTIQGVDANLVVGVPVAIGVGLLVGGFNAMLVVMLRIPAIIATLASGYVLATATLLANSAISGFAVSGVLKAIAGGRVYGIPVMVMVAIVCVAAASFVLRFTAYGQMLAAVGQNRAAARLAGIKTGAVIATAFLISSVLASCTGLVLGAYVGGAFLEMGQPYLLQSVAAVVVGGTLIFGGAATAVGTFIASVLLILIVTTMQIMGLPPGTQDMVQGVVVILVLALASRDSAVPQIRKAFDAPPPQGEADGNPHNKIVPGGTSIIDG